MCCSLSLCSLRVLYTSQTGQVAPAGQPASYQPRAAVSAPDLCLHVLLFHANSRRRFLCKGSSSAPPVCSALRHHHLCPCAGGWSRVRGDGAGCRLPHHQPPPVPRWGSAPQRLRPSRPLALTPCTPLRVSPAQAGLERGGLFPLYLPEGAFPTTTVSLGRLSSSPEGRDALRHNSPGRSLYRGPFSTSVPSARGAPSRFP